MRRLWTVFASPLLGAAWGARYSLGARDMRPLVVMSFLVAYLLYLLVAHAPAPWSAAAVCALPLASWALWMSDASARHELSAEVFPERGADASAMPGELAAGSWEARVLPWRAIGVLVLAAFVGNLMASAVMGRGYAGADSLFFGGIVVCACIATMSLVPLTADRNVLSVESVYRITLTFTAVGLVAIMVFGAEGIPVGGALVSGSAFYLQVLVFLVITQSTQGGGAVAAAVVQRGAGAHLGRRVCGQRAGQVRCFPCSDPESSCWTRCAAPVAGAVLHAGGPCEPCMWRRVARNACGGGAAWGRGAFGYGLRRGRRAGARGPLRAALRPDETRDGGCSAIWRAGAACPTSPTRCS